jgi:hypothetical protein
VDGHRLAHLDQGRQGRDPHPREGDGVGQQPRLVPRPGQHQVQVQIAVHIHGQHAEGPLRVGRELVGRVVREQASAGIQQHAVLPGAGRDEVRQTILVEVAHGDRHRVQGRQRDRRGGHGGEVPGPVVQEQSQAGRAPGQDQVQVPVGVHVGHAQAQGPRQARGQARGRGIGKAPQAIVEQ